MSHPHQESRKLLYRLLKDAKPYWRHLGWIFILSLSSTPLALLTPFPLKLAVDNVLSGKPLPTLLRGIVPRFLLSSSQGIILFACLLTFLILVLQALQSYAIWVYQLYISEKLILLTRARLFHHVQTLSLRHHDGKGTADLLYRLQNDVYNSQSITIYGLIPFLTSCVTFLAMFLITFQIDWKLALVALGVLPVMLAISRMHAPQSRNRWAQMKDSEQKAIGVIQEVIGNIRVVKTFSMEKNEAERFREKAELNLSRYMGAILTESAFGISVAIIIALASALALYLGIRHVQLGILTFGSLLVVTAYLAQLFKPLELFSKQLALVQTALASAERIYSLFDELPDVRDIENPSSIMRTQGAIEFKNASFQFRPGQPALKNISFKIFPKQRVGIVGPTGSGKTTLIHLLVRLFDPVSGSITLDEVDLRSYRLSDLRNQFSLVLQEPILFSGTIEENISYGKFGAKENEIIDASKLAGAHDFITRLPEGYQTILGEKGAGLSGGERQRISIARAFLRDAPILVMDEPTSSIDAAQEDGIVSSLERLQKGRTSFTVSHRPALLRNHDVMIRIEGGNLVFIKNMGKSTDKNTGIEAQVFEGVK